MTVFMKLSMAQWVVMTLKPIQKGKLWLASDHYAFNIMMVRPITKSQRKRMESNR